MTIDEYNRQYGDAYWKKRQARVDELLANPVIARAALRREQQKARFVHLAPNEAIRVERIRNQVSFEQELENLAEDLVSLPISEGQRSRARKRRGKLANTNKTVDEVIGELAICRESQDKIAKQLWEEFYTKLEVLRLRPLRCDNDDARKAAFEYDAKRGRQRITYGRFGNVVSQHRRQQKVTLAG